jgi:hypothetical protein
MFYDLTQISKMSVEGAFVLFMIVCSYKLYKMKIHMLSRCCGKRGNEGIIIETMNKAGSSNNLEFTNLDKSNDEV